MLRIENTITDVHQTWTYIPVEVFLFVFFKAIRTLIHGRSVRWVCIAISKPAYISGTKM